MMKIKGFDKDLKCRGFQFEIGKEYDTGVPDDKLELCSDTVFHYCDSLQQVHEYYNCTEDNRYCEIEVLGKEITDGEKCGSNRIRIVREITGDELKALKGLERGNTKLKKGISTQKHEKDDGFFRKNAYFCGYINITWQ